MAARLCRAAGGFAALVLASLTLLGPAEAAVECRRDAQGVRRCGVTPSQPSRPPGPVAGPNARRAPVDQRSLPRPVTRPKPAPCTPGSPGCPPR